MARARRPRAFSRRRIPASGLLDRLSEIPGGPCRALGRRIRVSKSLPRRPQSGKSPFEMRSQSSRRGLRPLEEPGEGSCLPGMIPVGAFCIDRFEAALVEVLAGFRGGDCKPCWRRHRFQNIDRVAPATRPTATLNALVQALGCDLCWRGFDGVVRANQIVQLGKPKDIRRNLPKLACVDAELFK